MSIFLTETDRVIVQGMTGSEGRKHTTRMLSAGTKIVAGVNPRKAGTTVAFDVTPIGPGAGEVQAGTVEVPVYGTVAEAKEATAERDAREKAELTRALGLESDGKIPAALRAQIRQLEEDQKRRAKRARTDVLDRAMIDLLSFYRDVLTTQMGSDVERVNLDLSDAVDQAARTTSPEQSLARIAAIEECRSRLRSNAAPLLAVEALMVQLRPQAEGR